MRPPILGLPGDYPELLGTIKGRIQHERLSAVIAANSAMVLLYWDIGRMILERQHAYGWGAKIIDRLASDLRDAYPDMKGLSPRNLKYMRAFCAAWPDRAIVQAPLAQLTWYHNIALLEKVSGKADRLWHARAVIQHGWSQSVLVMQIQGCAHLRNGKAVSNFKSTMSPADSDMAAQPGWRQAFQNKRPSATQTRLIAATESVKQKRLPHETRPPNSLAGAAHGGGFQPSASRVEHIIETRALFRSSHDLREQPLPEWNRNR